MEGGGYLHYFTEGAETGQEYQTLYGISLHSQRQLPKQNWPGSHLFVGGWSKAVAGGTASCVLSLSPSLNPHRGSSQALGTGNPPVVFCCCLLGTSRPLPAVVETKYKLALAHRFHYRAPERKHLELREEGLSTASSAARREYPPQRHCCSHHSLLTNNKHIVFSIPSESLSNPGLQSLHQPAPGGTLQIHPSSRPWAG